MEGVGQVGGEGVVVAGVEEGEGHHPLGHQEVATHSHHHHCGGKEQGGGGGDHSESQVMRRALQGGAR